MSDKIFLDSNILIYCFTSADVKKRSIARELAFNKNAYISTQVLNETVNILYKKYNTSWSELINLINDFEQNFFVRTVGANDIKSACNIAEKYHFSFYDSLILSAAAALNCGILYSEDLQHKQKVDDITIINPFA